MATENQTLNHLDNEIAQFDALASRWWDITGPFKPLHQLNPVRMGFIENHVNLMGKMVLDVGCGGGILTESLTQTGAQCTGIDMAPNVIQVAKIHAIESALTIDYQVSSIEHWAEAHPQKYDVITCMEMLEHVPNPLSVIQACQQLLKPQGLVFFSTLNRNFQSYLQAIIGAEYILGLLPKGTHRYDQFITPAELTRWLRQSSLTLESMAGMQYHPLSRTFSLCEDLSVNYLVMAKKEN